MDNQLKESNNQLKETQQSTTSCSIRNISSGGNRIATAMAMVANDNDNGSGRQVMGCRVWGGRQVAEGSRNGNKAEMGTMQL